MLGSQSAMGLAKIPVKEPCMLDVSPMSMGYPRMLSDRGDHYLLWLGRGVLVIQKDRLADWGFSTIRMYEREVEGLRVVRFRFE